MGKKHRSADSKQGVIAFSVSYERDNLLARGLGLDHLKELVTRIARPLLRNNMSLSYSGHWKDEEDNFTLHLLRLIAAEQEDSSLGGPDTSYAIGRLYNYCAWPHYLGITPKIEAQWINCCRIVRVTQKDAGIADQDIVAVLPAGEADARTSFNAAVTVRAMRQRMMLGTTIVNADAPSEWIPPVTARVMLGGKVEKYSGFMPGLFEEALEQLRNQRPLYILGGFGGASALLAKAILGAPGGRPAEFTLAGTKNAALTALQDGATGFQLPPNMPSVEQQLDDLFGFIERARVDPAATLRTGLDDNETRELLATCSVADAVRLTRKGMDSQLNLSILAA